MIAPGRERKPARWLVVIAVGIILCVIVLGHHGDSLVQRKVELIPFVSLARNVACLTYGACRWRLGALVDLAVDFVGNVLVFMPFGALLASALDERSHPALTSMMVGAVLSIAFEIAQLWIPGRVVSTTDVILNTLGALLGAEMVVLANRHHRQCSDASATAHGTHGVR